MKAPSPHTADNVYYVKSKVMSAQVGTISPPVAGTTDVSYDGTEAPECGEKEPSGSASAAVGGASIGFAPGDGIQTGPPEERPMGQSEQGTLEAFYRDLLHELDGLAGVRPPRLLGLLWW